MKKIILTTAMLFISASVFGAAYTEEQGFVDEDEQGEHQEFTFGNYTPYQLDPLDAMRIRMTFRGASGATNTIFVEPLVEDPDVALEELLNERVVEVTAEIIQQFQGRAEIASVRSYNAEAFQEPGIFAFSPNLAENDIILTKNDTIVPYNILE